MVRTAGLALGSSEQVADHKGFAHGEYFAHRMVVVGTDWCYLAYQLDEGAAVEEWHP